MHITDVTEEEEFMEAHIVQRNGRGQIQVDGKIMDAVSFKSFRPKDFNVEDFYRAGVRIFNVITTGLCSAYGMPYSVWGESWLGEDQYDFGAVDRQLDFFIEHAPEAYFVLNFHLDTRPWFLEKYRDAADSYQYLSQEAADVRWRRAAGAYLQALITHVEEKYGGKVIGYTLLGGYTTEWFSNMDYEAAHPIKLAAYREYLHDPEAVIPEKARRERPQEQLFLDPVKDADVIEYRKFHNRLIADTVLYYLEKAQEVLRHKKLVGLFFGYILELLGQRLWNAGHLDIDRVYASDNYDFIATPSSYQFRNYEQAGAYMLMTSTLNLHKKIYFISFDHRTYLYNDHVDGFYVPPVGRLLANNRQVADVMRREMMQRLVNGAGSWWFDMFAGWFRDEAIMADVKHLIDVCRPLLETPMRSNAEIVFVLSCDAMYSVNKMCGINTYSLCNARDAWARMGAPYDVISIKDMELANWKQYKLAIFPNAYSLDEKERAFIRGHVACDGRTLLWQTAADYVHPGGFSQAAMEACVGMRLGELPADETSLQAFGTVCGQYEHPLHPTFTVQDDGAEILGAYTASGAAALARKAQAGYISVFSGLSNLSARALHEIARAAGVHLYAEAGVPVYVNSALTGVYWHEARDIALNMPEDGEYEDIFTGKRYTAVEHKLLLNTEESAGIMLKKL